MINKIGFKNIKVFKEYFELEITPIMVLTGTNNSGKSSLQKMLLLLQEGFKKHNGLLFIEKLKIEKELANSIGSFESIISKSSKSKKFTLTFHHSSNEYKHLKTELTYEVKDDFYSADLVLCSQEIDNKTKIEFEITKKSSFCDFALKVTDKYTWRLLNIKPLLVENLLYPSLLRAKDDKSNILHKQTVKVFNCKIDTFLLETVLVNNVLGEVNLFTTPKLNPKQTQLLELLVSNNILSEQEFKEQYRNFEIKCILLLSRRSFSINNDDFDRDNFDYPIFTATILDSSDNGEEETMVRALSEPVFENDLIAKLLLITGEAKEMFVNKGRNDFDGKYKSFIRGSGFTPLAPICNIHLAKSVIYAIREISGFKNLLTNCSDKFEIKRFYQIDDPNESLFVNYANSREKSVLTKVGVEFINNWLSRFGIADKLVIEDVKAKNNLLGYAYYLLRNGKLEAMSDNGLGINKLIYLLIRIISSNSNNNNIIILEEPEANLHPAYQSLLAEMLIDSLKEVKFDDGYEFRGLKRKFKFLIETHSEYFIRKLQYLVAKKEINPEDISIYYFENPHTKFEGKQIKRLEIRPDGVLKQDFGTGFFDESIKLTMDLLSLKNRN